MELIRFARTRNKFLTILPPKQRGKAEFEVDVYSMTMDQPKNGQVHFEWDKKVVAMDAMFPLVKYKPLVSPSKTMVNENDSTPFFYMPFNTKCYLQNLYGEDFMTPKPGYKIPHKDASETKILINNPPCGQELSDSEKVEFERQMFFLKNTNELQSAF